MHHTVLSLILSMAFALSLTTTAGFLAVLLTAGLSQRFPSRATAVVVGAAVGASVAAAGTILAGLSAPNVATCMGVGALCGMAGASMATARHSHAQLAV